MTRFRLLLALVAAFVLSSAAEAGPLRRTVSRTTQVATACVGGVCNVATAAVGATKTVVRGSVDSARGVAEILAGERRLRHPGGTYGYEGVGRGSTPEQALRSCCNNGGMVVDEGVALGSDGQWYACRRYR